MTQAEESVVVAPGEQRAIDPAFSYVIWFFLGLFGGHRYMLGRPLTGLLWNLTLGLFFIGWIVDAFLLPDMTRDFNERFVSGSYDYHIAWIFFWLLGLLGVHRFYLGKVGTGVLYLLTLGLLGFGVIYDMFTLSRQVNDQIQRAGA